MTSPAPHLNGNILPEILYVVCEKWSSYCTSSNQVFVVIVVTLYYVHTYINIKARVVIDPVVHLITTQLTLTIVSPVH